MSQDKSTARVLRQLYFPIQSQQQRPPTAQDQNSQGEFEEGGFSYYSNSQSRKKWHYRGIILLLNSAILVLVTLIYVRPIQDMRSNDVSIPNTLPNVPFEPKKFDYDKKYMGWPTVARNKAWMSLQGPPDQHPTFVTFNKKSYQITMYHQLHCLAMVRKMLWDVVLGNEDAKQLLGGSIPDMTSEDTLGNYNTTVHWRLQHADHCLDFIRQGLQCNGDVGLEPAIMGENNIIAGVMFGTISHQCRSWDYVRKFAEDHRPAPS
ncbi:hypothetical protein BT63DRAFT_456614 [Microthyrium microscopicum]|uniref:Oxidase ustYa n=1 Tax=Microthyrium microscopicum TaxID=703497 RepID=A0A6A6U4U1_9PEZI|nr:hypothetical protein BT63DRAFT_456614 [Microthyrium microscopicum]